MRSLARAMAIALTALVACSDSSDRADADARAEVDPDTSPADTSDANGDTARPDVADADAGDAAPAECEVDLDCRLPCAEGRCLDGRCTYAAADPTASGCLDGEPLACVAPGAPSPASACLFCNPHAALIGYSNVALAETFEVGAGRLLIEKLTPSSASWTISSRRAADGERSLYFGDAALGTYDVGERAAARAVTPPIALPADPPELTVGFQLFADTEETPGFDRLQLLVLPPASGDDDAVAPVVVWSSDEIGGTTHGEFLPIAVALGPLAPGQRLAFEADSVDGIINGFEGFYIDSVRLFSGCCDAEHPCDDGNPCTDDACGDGLCTFTARASCCLSDGDCDDGDPCSDDRCQRAAGERGGACVSVPRPDCCAAASDCDDGDPCTEDACLTEADGAGRCRQAPLCCASDAACDDGDACTIGTCLDGQCHYRSACCRADADCDDGVACTLDRCEAGVCHNDFTYERGCCVPDVLSERFDAGAPGGWNLSPPANNVGWRVHPNPSAPSGTHVLYYGHPTLNFYESGGRNSGTATTPLVRLPDGVELKLSFQVLLDVEDNPQRDLFAVEALIGQAVVPLVGKAELTLGRWQEVQVDLTWAASQAIQIRFSFDSVDGAQNTTRGVLLDDVRLLSTCLPRRCGLDAECGSRASCIVGTCDDGQCRYGGGC